MSWLRIAVAVAVTLVWAVGYLLSFFAGAEQPVTVTPVMLAVVGWLFAQEIRDQIRERSGKTKAKAKTRTRKTKEPDADE